MVSDDEAATTATAVTVEPVQQSESVFHGRNSEDRVNSAPQQADEHSKVEQRAMPYKVIKARFVGNRT